MENNIVENEVVVDNTYVSEPKKLLEIFKEGEDYGFQVFAGTSGTDIEVGLANLIVFLVKHERERNPQFCARVLTEMLLKWVEIIENGE